LVTVAGGARSHRRRSAVASLLGVLLLAAVLTVLAVLLSGGLWEASAQGAQVPAPSPPTDEAAGQAAAGKVVFATAAHARAKTSPAGGLLAAGRSSGYVAPPVAVAPAPGVRFASIARDLPSRYVAPAAYDLRDFGKVSRIRDQGRFGTCWAFAALGSLESALLPSQAWDLSEKHMASRSGFDLSFDAGGNSRMAAAYLTRWDGPVVEQDDRYGLAGASPAGLPERLHVRDVLFLPPRGGATDNDNLKWAIATYGAVDTSMYWDDYCFDRRQATYYYSGSGLNHDVTCVGWDDRYPAAKFAVRPAGDGAFLCRNSWGAGFGDRGYFWVSYYDGSFAADAAVFAGAGSPGDYSAVYGHDSLGWVDAVGYSPSRGSAWFAARHTAVSSGGIAAAGFYTPAPRSSYEIYAGPSLEQLSAEPLATGTVAVPGYHTVDLAARPPVTAGETFVVAIRLTTPGFAWPVAVERGYPGYASPQVAPGQSFLSGDGTHWTDLGAAAPAADVCLKIFTVGEAPRVTPPTVIVDRCLAVRKGTARIVFHVAHADPATTATVSLKIVSRRGKIVDRIVLRDVPCEKRTVALGTVHLKRGTYRIVASALDTEGHRQLGELWAGVRISSTGR
jgi:C1A family cysteine protease